MDVGTKVQVTAGVKERSVDRRVDEARLDGSGDLRDSKSRLVRCGGRTYAIWYPSDGIESCSVQMWFG